MDLRQTIRRILKEEKKTKSTNKEFVKYKDSKFHSLRDFTYKILLIIGNYFLTTKMIT